MSSAPVPQNIRMPLPSALAAKTRFMRLGRSQVPALVAHPDWSTPAPVLIWMHGRTVNKELDNGRYLRLIRAGIAAVALDLPGHGERLIPEYHTGSRSPDMIAQMVGELDEVIEALTEPPGAPESAHCFDLDRLAIGGMSAGGMCTLRKLCIPGHGFCCASIEGTTGDLDTLYRGGPGRPWPVDHDAAKVAAVDPIRHLAGFTPVPLLALHSDADAVVPFAGQLSFLNTLRAHYTSRGSDPALIELKTWPTTGAPQEHNGFGRVAALAKTAQIDFLTRWLKPTPPTEAI